MSPRDDDRSDRQIARSQRRKAGDRSARIAHALMTLPLSSVRKVVIDQELRITVDRARAITSMGARRRAERTLAGELRRYDLVVLDQRLARVHESENTETELFHLAEGWRDRLIAQGSAALAEVPGGAGEELPRLVDAAQRERTTGKPPGAGRKLFRHVVEMLRTQQPPADEADEAGDADDGDQDRRAPTRTDAE